MHIVEIFSIVIIHWIADFIFQDEKWAVGKSKNLDDLLNHTTVYSLLWWIPVSIMLDSISLGSLFVIITFIIHTITDYFTSSKVNQLFEDKKLGSSIPNIGAFSVIGFDQVLHYLQLFGTYYILTKI